MSQITTSGGWRRRGRFQHRQGTGDLLALIIRPWPVLLFRRPEPGLINNENGCIHHAVGQRLKGQGGKARLATRDDEATAGLDIHPFHDDPGIVERCPVIGDQNRDFAEGVLLAQAVAGIPGVGRLDAQPVGQSAQGGGDLDLAAERRGRR